MDPKFPAMMTVNINYDDHDVVMVTEISTSSSMEKKLPRRAYKWYLAVMATQCI